MVSEAAEDWEYRLSEDEGMKSWLFKIVPLIYCRWCNSCQNVATFDLSNQKFQRLVASLYGAAKSANVGGTLDEWRRIRRTESRTSSPRKIRKTFPAMWYHKQKAFNGTIIWCAFHLEEVGSSGISLIITWIADWGRFSIADSSFGYFLDQASFCSKVRPSKRSDCANGI